MTRSAGDRLQRAMAAWCNLLGRGAPAVVVAALAVTGLALVYTFETLTIDTSTEGMISPDVPFRRHNEAFTEAFPALRDNIVAVIDAPTPERAEQAAEDLGRRLAADDEDFKRTYVPGSEAFLEQNAFLYLDTDELARLADRLAAAEPLLARLAEDPSLRGLADVLHQALERGDPEELDELAEVIQQMATVAQALRAGRPLNLSWQSLLAGPEQEQASRTRRFVITQPILKEGSLVPAATGIRDLRRTAAELGIAGAPGLRLRLTGQPVLEQQELESVRLGGTTAALLSLGLVLALLVVGLRSWRLVVATVTTLLMGLAWTAAFAALALGHLNLISVAFAVLFVGLAVDFGIHLTLRYREELAHGLQQDAALQRASAGVGGALVLSAVAAATGFYAFLPTDFRGLAELGLISGSGMFVALAASLTVLPAMLVLLPLHRRAADPAAAQASRFASLAARRRRPILMLAAVLGAAGLAALPFVRFDFNPIHLKDPAAESVATFLDLAEDPDTTPYTVDLLADDLEDADANARRLETLDEVDRAMTLSDFVPERQEEKLVIVEDMATFLAPALMLPAQKPAPDAGARRRAFEQLRADAAAAAAAGGPLVEPALRLRAALAALDGDGGPSDATLAELEERYTAYLPTALERLRAALTAQPLTRAELPADFRERWVAQDGRARIEIFPQHAVRSNAELYGFAEAVLAVEPMATGTPIVVTQAAKAVVRAFVEASVLALVLIVALLLVVLRRLLDAVLVLAPLLLAAILTGAGSAVLGVPFNFANVIVLPLLMGLGVASGIHLVLRQREEGDSAAVLASSTPRAVLFSALTTLASFGSLAASGHRGMNSMGELLTIAIVCTLFAMLVVLPGLMAALGKPRSREVRP